MKCLLDRGAGRAALPAGLRRELPTAIENAMCLGYDAFAGQVLAYLAAEYQLYYGARRVWETLQEEVVEALEKR